MIIIKKKLPIILIFFGIFLLTGCNQIKKLYPVYFKYQGNVWYSAILSDSRSESKIVFGADPESFYERKQEYGVDKNFVYCAGTKLEGSDGKTFNDDDPNYAFDKNQVYYPYCNIISGADGSSFQVIATGTYGKDKYHVYHYNTLIEGSDSATFQFLDWSYMKDKNNVYFSSNYNDPEGGMIYLDEKITDADPITFNTLSKYGFAKDKDHLYYLGKITSIDYASVNNFDGTPYLIDKDSAYYNGTILQNSDPKSFEIFNSYKYGNSFYAKDKTHVYHEGNIIIDADPASFDILGPFGRDKNYVYYQGKKFQGSDGPSFKLKDKTSCCEGIDKNYIYSYGCIYKNNKQILCIE